MRRTQKVTLIVASLSLVGLLTGCGGSSGTQEAKPAAQKAPSSNSSTTSASTSGTPSTAKASTTTPNQNKQAAVVTTKPQQPAKSESTEGKLNSSLGTVMNMDEKSLQKNMQSGKSLAEIAKTQGVSEDKVIDTFVSNLKETLDKNVASGKLTKAKEEQMLSDSRATFKKIVEQKSAK